ncbi:MAG: helix-turn-helix domain-containing protein [Eubacteriales bacterium]|nr:helix-turn-helix domain-containing protein [Eubacteriales bacterium]
MLKDKLRSLRLRAGMTQDDLAARLYVSRTLVTKWETGRRVPGRALLPQLAEALAVPVSELEEAGELTEQDELADVAARLPESDADEDLLVRQMARRISVFLRSLPKKDRDLFLRRYYYHDSVAAAARFTGRTEADAADALRQTRQALAEQLEKEG